MTSVPIIVVALLSVGLSGGPRATQGPDILVTMQVDRLVVEPGEVVTYSVRVDNVGDADSPHVGVTAHLPEHTSAGTEHCPDGTVEPDGDVCVHPEVPTPGAGDRAHQVVHSRSPLAAGDGFTLTFSVRVDDATLLGTVLDNHAHASTPLGEERSTASMQTVVADRVPRAVAGADAVGLSGTVVTDSYASSLGSYDATRSPSGGDVVSNGDIQLSGRVVMNGDAQPGPGHRVASSGRAVVTGSTTAAALPFALPPVDAEPYETNNANRLLCASGGACADAFFSSDTKAFRVSGRATVPPGAYYLCDLEVRGHLEVRGPVTFWIGSPDVCPMVRGVRFISGAVVEIASGRPRDFRVRVQGSALRETAVELRSRATFTGVVYAPASDLVIDGDAQVFGELTAGEVLTGTGGASFHVDRSLQGTP